MLVVFISAEFIQISAGLAYPWYMAVILCDIGVFVGATLIFLLVRTTKFNGEIFKKSSDKINNFSSSNSRRIPIVHPRYDSMPRMLRRRAL